LIGLGGHTAVQLATNLHFETRLFGEPFDSGKYIDFQTFALKADKVYYKNKIFATDLADLGKKQTVQSSVAGGSSGKHVIRKGDNLWTIAKRYHTTVNKLCALNNISPQKTLKVGSVLRVN
jgi:LysM repeat protein